MAIVSQPIDISTMYQDLHATSPATPVQFDFTFTGPRGDRRAMAAAVAGYTREVGDPTVFRGEVGALGGRQLGVSLSGQAVAVEIVVKGIAKAFGLDLGCQGADREVIS